MCSISLLLRNIREYKEVEIYGQLVDNASVGDDKHVKVLSNLKS